MKELKEVLKMTLDNTTFTVEIVGLPFRQVRDGLKGDVFDCDLIS